MTNIQIFYLSLLQGITEFLPVSSSGHLVLLSKFSNFPDQGLALDVAVHVGSILAVMIYFSSTIWEMIKGVFKTYFLPNFKNEGSKLFWLIVIGTIPAVIAGFLLKENGMESVIDDVYRKCKAQESLEDAQMVNYVKEIYAPFTDEQIADKIAQMITSEDTHARISVIFQTLDGLHDACPIHLGDWYFSGDYPTVGGNRMVNNAFIAYMEGKSSK